MTSALTAGQAFATNALTLGVTNLMELAAAVAR
jgi:hypothetical protein